MQIRLRSNGQVMFEEAFRQYIASNGGPSWGQTTTEILDELQADVVFDGPSPTLTHCQVASAGPAIEENGQWYTSFVVTDMDADAKAATDAAQAASVRQQRNAKLTACDWTQVADAPVDKAAWATYRQALRDLPKEAGFPWEITWPTAPTA